MNRLHELLRQYREVFDAMQAATADTRRRLDELSRQLAEDEAPYRERLQDLSQQIESEVHGNGITKTFSTEWATVKYRAGYIRRSWNDKMLLGYAQAHPEIMAFAKETHVPPKISIIV